MKPLAERLADGDDAAFQVLYDRCGQRLFRFLVAKTGSCDLAADALQETFLRAVRFREQLRAVNNLDAWMFTIARREANRILTRSNRTPHSDSIDATKIESPTPPDQSGVDERDELETALAGLTLVEREILDLHIYGGLTFRKVAELTDTRPGTVATRYRSAIAKLRRRLDVVSVPTRTTTKETKQ